MVDRTDRKWHYAENLGKLSACKIKPYQATRWWEDVTCPVCLGMKPVYDTKSQDDAPIGKGEV